VVSAPLLPTFHLSICQGGKSESVCRQTEHCLQRTGSVVLNRHWFAGSTTPLDQRLNQLQAQTSPPSENEKVTRATWSVLLNRAIYSIYGRTRPCSPQYPSLELRISPFCQSCLLTLCYVLQMTGESVQTPAARFSCFQYSSFSYYFLFFSFFWFYWGHFAELVCCGACTAENTNPN